MPSNATRSLKCLQRCTYCRFGSGYFCLCSEATFMASSDISLTSAMALLVKMHRWGTQPARGWGRQSPTSPQGIGWGHLKYHLEFSSTPLSVPAQPSYECNGAAVSARPLVQVPLHQGSISQWSSLQRVLWEGRSWPSPRCPPGPPGSVWRVNWGPRGTG